MQDALQDDLNQEVIMLWHKDTDLGGLDKDDCIVLPGGFSYGDYLRCGAIARFSPIMQSISRFAAEGGKVFGVCNGFQILCESHLSCPARSFVTPTGNSFPGIFICGAQVIRGEPSKYPSPMAKAVTSPMTGPSTSWKWMAR